MSGNDKPPKAAYDKWAQLNNVSVTWDQLTTAQPVNWQAIAQAAIDANE